MSKVRIQNAQVCIGCSPSPREGWTSYRFNFRGFRDLTTAKNHCVMTPRFTCSDHEWTLDLYPGGVHLATDGYMSIYLTLRSEVSTAATHEITLLDKFGNAERVKQMTDRIFDKSAWEWPSLGWCNFINRSDILDASNNILDSSGTLAIVVSMKDEPTAVFVPPNPLLNMMQEMFNDDTTADVCFEVANGADEVEKDEKIAGGSTSFHAHTFILKKCAPMLDDLIPHGNDMGKAASVQVSDVQPDIFRHLLWYVYGGKIAEDTLKANAKDIIDAADKYSIVNLKLEAEAAYVKSTTFTAENVLDNLLYAEAMNLALLKEAVIDFLVGNGEQIIDEVTFSHIPGCLMKDLLVATTRSVKESKNEVATDMNLMRVSELRRKLNEKGLDVDGSREAMIASLIRSESVGNNATLLEAEDEVNEDEDEDENNAEEE
eukprot:scaffold15288_cov91-Skeletonema_dohrnii-CCMP3373.AAC.2